jgi:hypothetical protein
MGFLTMKKAPQEKGSSGRFTRLFITPGEVELLNQRLAVAAVPEGGAAARDRVSRARPFRTGILAMTRFGYAF